MNIYSYIKGNLSSLLLYPVSQKFQHRNISTKFNQMHKDYSVDYSVRKKKNLESLISILEFSRKNVPYYRDLFASIAFDPQKLRTDFNHFYSIPCLTKDIILEQGTRMLREDFSEHRFHLFKTGGSTGNSVHIYYDQEALDWSSAVTLYARDMIGHKRWKSEIHFSSRFPEKFPLRDRVKEHVKCFIMNRKNVYSDSIDDGALENIWKQIRKSRPYLVHSHPSTMYALAIWARENNKERRLFDVFESSGELLDEKKRSLISEVFDCRVVDRYGLAEFGVVAYQMLDGDRLQVFDGFVFPEARVFDHEAQVSELVFSGLTNYFMPLIRYRTGDCGEVEENEQGLSIANITGRIHDVVELQGNQYPTHYIQDVLDRVGGIKEFQIKLQGDDSLVLTLVPEDNVDEKIIAARIRSYWPGEYEISFIKHSDIITVGWRDKFRYVVDLR